VLRGERDRSDLQIKNLNERISSILAKQEITATEHRNVISDLTAKRQVTETDLERTNKENRSITSELKVRGVLYKD